MDANLIRSLFTSFESIRQIVGGVECWSARELQKLLGYTEWRNFLAVIEKARTACKTSGENDADHFVEINKMIALGKGGERQVDDLALTRYACYLVAQNGDPAKLAIAFAMTYFAAQTRKQEIIEQRLGEIDRLRAREKLTETERVLSGIIYERGVDNQGFGIIRSKGDQALFGGFSTGAMKKKLSVPATRALADFLPTVTIKAKDLATEMTNVNVVEKDLQGQDPIVNEHVQNNQAVRKALGERGIRPELLPASEDLDKVKRKITSESKRTLDDMKRLRSKKED
ncbi:MAG TPA: DNA damage-inducible protein D [Candidatus Kapabacteria bacterium]|nr:DNA damage-inducible protein D [Candidatus Kapabacteria bacterium]